MSRSPVAPHFYSGDCAAQIEQFLAGFEPPAEPADPVAGIAPHAGWVYSGDLAAKVVRCLAATRPETFVIFGTVHDPAVHRFAVYESGAWRTPLGDCEVDDELAAGLLERCSDLLVADKSAHSDEHSIEVLLPMIRVLCPDAKIVPVAAPPLRSAAKTGSAVGAALTGLDRRVVVLGSTDLTHYGIGYRFCPWGIGPEALENVRANDRRLIDLVLRLDADAIVDEAHERRNACGGGAIAATVAAAAALGAERGELLQYTTSHDVMHEPPDQFEMAVGYAGILLGR